MYPYYLLKYYLLM